MSGPLIQVPWQLLLPSDRTKPVLLLAVAGSQELLPEGWRFETSETAGPFAAAVRLPGGPALEPATLDSVAGLLLPGGHLLWISDRAHCSSLPPASGFHAVCFAASGRALWSPSADWAQPLHGTGKMDLVARLFRRAPGRFARLRGITVMVPGGSEGCGWIFDLVEDLAKRGVADIGSDGLGRIDRTRTGMAICQIVARSGEKFALKVGLGDREAGEMIDECRCLETLRRDSDLPAEMLEALPRILASGEFSGFHYRLESWIDGHPASELMYRRRDRAVVVNRAVRWITEFHKVTRGSDRDAAADADSARSILVRVSSLLGRADEKFADHVAAYLMERLDRYAVPTVHGHGDFWLGNVICERPAGPIRGIIDWKQAVEEAPPLEDVLHLLFYRKWLFSQFDPEDHLVALVERRYDHRDRRLIGQYVRDLDLEPGVAGALVVLYWVRYLTARETILAAQPGWPRSHLRLRGVLERRLGSDLDRLGSWLVEP